MKKLFLAFFLIYSSLCFSQISVSNNHNRNTKKLDTAVFNSFKKTETIFVLPSIINTETYNAILKEYWKITPYQLVDYKTFKFKNYPGNKYSFVYLDTSIKTIDKSRAINIYIYANLDLFMRNKDLKEKHKDKWFEKKTDIARVLLFPKNDFLKTLANARDKKSDLKKLTHENDVFYNFNAGYFKNYIQKIHQELTKQNTKNNEPYYVYENDFLPEIKNLATATLYIPEYLGLKFNGFRETNTNKNVNHIKKLFSAYDFEYRIVKNSELNTLIMENKDFYYAKFIRINTQRFLHIINAHTGEIIYRKYLPGIAYNLNSKHIANLNSKIKKAQLQ